MRRHHKKLCALGVLCLLAVGMDARAADGYALFFDSLTDMITTTNKITTVAFTAEFWVRPQGLTVNDERNVVGQYAGGTGRTLFQVRYLKTRLFHGNGSPANEVIGATTLANDVWTHLAYTRDETGLAKVYVNGVLDGQANLGTALVEQGTTLRVGGFNSVAMLGPYSEIRVWSHAKTGAEIAAAMRTRAIGNEPGLILHLPFDNNLFQSATIEAVSDRGYSAAGVPSVFRGDLPFAFELPDVSAACTNRGYVLSFTNGVVRAFADMENNMHITSETFTIESWVRPTELEGEKQIFNYSLRIASEGPTRFKFRINDTNGVLRTQSGDRVLDALNVVQTNRWLHYAITRDADGVFSTFLNGELAARRSLNATTNVTEAAQFMFGNDGISTNSAGEVLSGPFVGDLCEGRVWDTALTREQIQSNLFTRLAGTEPGLAFYWSMDEGHHSRLRSPVGNGTSVLNGAYQWTMRDDVPVRPIAAPGRALRFTDGTHMVTTPARITTVAFTVELWARFNHFDNDAQHGNGEFQLFNQDIPSDSGRLFFHVRSKVPNFQIGNNTLSASLALTTNRWYHLAFTRDASGHSIIYVNGRLWGQQSLGTVLPSAANISLGRLDRTATSCFIGKLSEVRVWNVARTQEELVKTMHHRLDVCDAPGIQYYWPLNQVQDSLVLEMASGAHGTFADPDWVERDDLPFILPVKPDYPKGTILTIR